MLTSSPNRADVLAGGPFRIAGSTASGGLSIGGPYALQGSVAFSGQGTSHGQTFELAGQVIAAYEIAFGALTLQVQLEPEWGVKLRWPMGIQGFVLEFTDTLEAAGSWQAMELPSNADTLTLGATQSARFFRLRKL